MGSNVSSCCVCDNILNCWDVFRRENYRRNQYFECGSLIEFQNLIGEVEYREPTSILTENERTFLKNKQYDLLIKEQAIKDAALELENAQHEEALELEEEVAIEARREAARVAKMVQSPEIIDPTKLAFTIQLQSCGFSDQNLEWKDHTTVPLASRSSERTSKINQHTQIGNSFLRQQAHTTNSTPPSSIDLEWENEEGLTPPTNMASMTDEEEITSMAITSTPSDASPRSTPMSNGNELEWDFTSAQITDIDAETEQLISEIERMTEDALKNTDNR